MNIAFPAVLENEIARLSQTIPPSQLMSQAASLSKHYRESMFGGTRPTVQGDLAALGYSVIIMPATYAQLTGAMLAVKQRVPNWQPTSLLDLGSGPGTALWAAQEQWPTLQKMVALEKEPAFIKLGQQLAKVSQAEAIRNTVWKKADLRGMTGLGSAETYDLVILGHVVNEMDPALQQAVVSYAWQRCSGLLLIVEPGTSVAFPIVKDMREYLLTQGAKTIAPCAHDNPCPLNTEKDWCHFPQRIIRPSFQRRAKGGTANWEESKFSYAAMARFPVEHEIWGRLIHQPNVQKGLVQLTVSSQEGIVQPVALKRHKDQFREWSDYKWGEIIPEPLEETRN